MVCIFRVFSRLPVVPLSLGLSCVTRNKTARKKKNGHFTRPFFPRGLFTVLLDGLSEREPTRSLNTISAIKTIVTETKYNISWLSNMVWYIFFQLNTLNGTAKDLAVDLPRLNALRDNKSLFLFQHHQGKASTSVVAFYIKVPPPGYCVTSC